MASGPPTWPIDRDRLARTRFADIRFYDQIASTNSELLAESAPGNFDVAVVVGVGLNVSAGAFPPELTGVATTCEDEAGRPVDRTELLVAFLEALETRYSGLFSPGGSERTLADYRAGSATLGRRVRVELGDGTAVEGAAGEVAGNGQLIVLDDAGGRVAVNSGDVIHLRPSETG